MKTRIGFVSNSSSCSFVVSLSPEQKKFIKRMAKKIGEELELTVEDLALTERFDEDYRDELIVRFKGVEAQVLDFDGKYRTLFQFILEDKGVKILKVCE